MDDSLIRRRDVEAAILADSVGRYCPPEPVDPYSWALSFVRDVPAVAAVEVRHGEWVERPTSGRFPTLECSACHSFSAGKELCKILIYCPKCGARMDGEEEHNAVDRR